MKMNISAKISLAVLTLAVLFNVSQKASAASEPAARNQCSALLEKTQAFSNIQDAPTTLSSAVLANAPDEALACQVMGKIGPGVHTTPGVGDVRFNLLLPANWNGKFIEIGCGGTCKNFSAWMIWCPVHRGYACIVSDLGNGRDDNKQDDNQFIDDLRARINFGYRATHIAALAGKAIVTSYYNKAPSKSMMMGCSTGGYQALVEAQRFPWDFDGLVAIAPDMDEADLAMRKAWFFRNWHLLNGADVQLLHDAALAKCDTTDGVKEPFVGNPLGCPFDPSALKCKVGQSAGCLSPDRVAAARNVYGAPVTSEGVRISTRLILPRSELSLSDYHQDYDENWALSFFRYMFTLAGNPDWKISDFDFDRDYKRLGEAAVFTDTNPDLRKFKAAKGKLIIAQGGSDAAEFPWAVIDYYNTLERTMGGRMATQEFARLFVVPGMHHCTAGEGAFAIDYLRYLELWVERGKAPEKLIGSHVPVEELIRSHDPELMWSKAMSLQFPLDSKIPVTFTRPIYPYPLWARYTGKGDPNKEENFEAVGPATR